MTELIFIIVCVAVSLWQLREFAKDAEWHKTEIKKKFDIFP